MKKNYTKPVVEVIRFDTEDVLTTSDTTPGFNADGVPVDENGIPLQ